MHLALLAILGAFFALPGCVTSTEPDIHIAQAPNEDLEYSEALQKATKERTVYKDFETRYRVTATYLSPEFRAAFGRRLERVYQRSEPLFEEANAKAGFFVSVHVPGVTNPELNNQQHWNVLMQSKEGALKPVLIKKVADKERWRAFFRSVTDWTQEYLVVFDAPSVNPQSPDLVVKQTVNVTFANADGQVSLTW